MRLRRKPQQEFVEPQPAATEQVGGWWEQGEPVGNDPRLPGSAGYGIRGLSKQKRHHMPATRFNYVRPDGKQE